MKTPLLWSLAVCLLGTSSVLANDHPLIKARTDRGDTAIFIGATHLFTPGGEFAAAVPTHWREWHEAYANRTNTRRARLSPQSSAQHGSSAPCGGVYLGEADVESPVTRNSVSSTLENAKAIYVGTIKSVTAGLFYGTPGSLLELGDLVTLKSTFAYANVHDSVLVRHPHAHFTARTVEYCRETHATALAPQRGDRVIAFAFADPLDEAGTLIYSHLNDLIVARDSDVRIPEYLEIFGTGALSIEEMADRITQAIARIDAEEQQSGVR